MTITYSQILNISYTGLTAQQESDAVAALQEIGSTVEGQTLYSLIQSAESLVDLEFSAVGSSNIIEVPGFTDKVTISFDQLSKSGYYGASGDLYNYSLQGALIHELYHVIEDNVLYGEALVEGLATQFANEYMAKYYGEERRIVYADELLSSQGLPDSDNIFNPNFNASGHAGYQFIGELGENIISLLTAMDTDEFENDAEFYFYKVIVDYHDRTFGNFSDGVTSNFYYATGDESFPLFEDSAGVLGRFRIFDDFLNGYDFNDELDTTASKIVYSFSGNDTITLTGITGLALSDVSVI